MMTIFMTEKEKLQQLFDAALKSPADFSMGPPKRAFPAAMNGKTAADQGKELQGAFCQMRTRNEQVAKTAAPQASMHP